MDISGIFDRTAQSISDAIKGAAAATGASFEYLLAAARAESGLDPQAGAATSSARGLYQFVDQTWFETMKRAGARLGYARYADAIVETAPGRYDVPDPALRREILALRDDPAANAALAGALTRDNAAILSERLGRAPSDGEVYLAHVLGAAGAARLTNLASFTPALPANAVFPAAAAANRAIFYDPQGRPRSVADVYALVLRRYDGARARSGAAPASTAPGSAATAPINLAAPVVDNAAGQISSGGAAAAAYSTNGAARAPAAPLFSRLFSDRGDETAPSLRNLWSDPPTRAAPLPSDVAGEASPTASGGSNMPSGANAIPKPAPGVGTLFGQ